MVSRIAILTPQFFQHSSNKCLFGGGERYLIDLANLLTGLGYEVDVFQPSLERWVRTYNGVRIFGIEKGEVDRDFYVGLNKEFYNVAKSYDHHIYFNMDVLYPYVFENSICISHGIWWDSTARKHWRTEKWYEYLFSGLDSVSHLVSVDTNTINFLNAVKPDLTCKKTYIPNYVDLNLFKADKTNKSEKINILFPRRFCAARGWNICLDTALELTEEYKNLVFYFVGRSSNENSEHIMELISKKNPKIKYNWYEMNDMPIAYKGMDIVLIPSLYSEGTSLSLLEALACGKPVIAGLVGGLSDLVLDGFNGLLIDVNKENLKKAILYLAENKTLRLSMSKNALLVSKNFSKDIWEDRWEKTILDNFTK